MFIHRIAAALCGLALFVVAADARANWSNTHWGMTVAEVQAIAPNGRALTDVEADAILLKPFVRADLRGEVERLLREKP